MEDVMLGSKRSISFWRQKRRLLNLERALASERKDADKNQLTAQAVAGARARDRMADEAKRKARFSEG
jgi:hypothetical protein